MKRSFVKHSLPAKPCGVVFFDIDGTLVTGTSSGSFLARRMGHALELDRAEAQYAAGQIDNHEVCLIDAKGWAGTPVDDVKMWLDELPLIEGVQESVAWCLERELAPVLASLAWDPVGAHLVERFGFAAHCGPTLALERGTFAGSVARSFDEFDKRDFALRMCEEFGVSAERCAAIGDSRSDLPLFAAVGFSIAFNASPDARAAATLALDSTSVLDAMPPIARWIEAG